MSKRVEVFRRNGNTFVSVGLASNNIFTSEEMEVGTWVNEKPIYRMVTTPTELTEVENVGDPYHYTYRTNIAISDVDQIISGTFLGTDTANRIKFCAPCYVFVKNNYLHFSSSNTVTIETSKFNLVIEYTKGAEEESGSESA